MNSIIPPPGIPPPSRPPSDENPDAPHGTGRAIFQTLAGFFGFFLLIGISWGGLYSGIISNLGELLIILVGAPIAFAIIPGTRWMGLGMLLALGVCILLLIAICGNMRF